MISLLEHHRSRVPFIAQTQKTECGLSCVCMINHYYRNYITMDELRRQVEIGRDGTSFLQLVELLKQYGHEVKSYRVDAENIGKIPAPAIILWNSRHFVVLEKITKNGYIIVDPAIGTLRVDKKEFEEKFSEFAVYAEPKDDFQRQKKSNENWRIFTPYLFQNKVIYLQIIIFSILLYACTLGLPVLAQLIVDQLIKSPNDCDISMVGIIMGVIGLTFFVTTFVKNVHLIRLRGVLDRNLNMGIFKHLLGLPYKFFSVRSSGDLTYTLNSSMRIREIFANQFITATIDCGAAIVILGYIYYVSTWLGITSTLLFMISVIVIGLTRPVLGDNSRSVTTSQSNVQAVQFETVYAMLGVKMSAIEEDVYKSWEQVYSSYYKKFIDNEKFSNYINSVTGLLQFISPTCLLFISLYLVKMNVITVGKVISVYSLSATFFSLSSSVFNLWTSFINSTVIFDRLSDIMNTEEEENHEDLAPFELKGEVKLKNVSFSYTKDSKKVLSDINLTIKSGMKVALVGKSGSGKSTLAKLMVGLYAPTEGEIYFDGNNFMDINQRSVRRQIGIVPQDITLFNKTIFENVVMNRAGITLQDVMNACEKAHIAEDIEAMPMKYYTSITELGLNLSGGQRQRIALARALIGNPKILLLDEATSSLDNINEKMVSDEFKRMGTTQVVIAHRLSTIIDSDLIVVLDHGKIVEQGDHESLMNLNGMYKELYHVGL